MNQVGQSTSGFDKERGDWHLLANKWGLQGVVLDWRHRLEHVFTCPEVGLTCDARNQASSFLVPWCCHQSWRHVMAVLEGLAVEKGLEYEITDGTVLGAVKLGNFIPWDIDADVEFRTSQFSEWKGGGAGASALKEAGILQYRMSEDCYSDKGAGFFYMSYEGVEVEMFGSKKNMSQSYYRHHMRHVPTRIQVGPDLWVRTHANPGLHVRGRYGPGYLYHVQSWRHTGLSSSYDKFSIVSWQPCSKPGHHSCLSNYPIQGNMELLPNIYP